MVIDNSRWVFLSFSTFFGHPPKNPLCKPKPQCWNKNCQGETNEPTNEVSNNVNAWCLVKISTSALRSRLPIGIPVSPFNLIWIPKLQQDNSKYTLFRQDMSFWMVSRFGFLDISSLFANTGILVRRICFMKPATHAVRWKHDVSFCRLCLSFLRHWQSRLKFWLKSSLVWLVGTAALSDIMPALKLRCEKQLSRERRCLAIQTNCEFLAKDWFTIGSLF